MNSPTKRCSKCGVEYPATIEFFHKLSKGKLTPRCKICRKDRTPAYTRIEYPTPPANQKRCSKCHKCFPATREYFHDDKHRPDRLTVRCISCILGHPSKPRILRTIPLPGFKRCGHCKLVKPIGEFQRASAKPDGFNSGCRSCTSEIAKQSRKNMTVEHKEINAIREHNRRAISANLPHTFTMEQWQTCKEFFNHRCACCQKSTKVLEQDHWVALTNTDPNNPGYTILNIIPLCRACNSSKSDNEAIAWLVWKFGEPQAKQILAQIEAYFEWVRIQGK